MPKIDFVCAETTTHLMEDEADEENQRFSVHDDVMEVLSAKSIRGYLKLVNVFLFEYSLA